MDAPPLSPYPFVRTGSPRRIQLSQNHPVYISPHKNETMLSPREKIFYYFSNSPSKVSLTYLGRHRQTLRMLEMVDGETGALTHVGNCQRKVASKSQCSRTREEGLGGKLSGWKSSKGFGFIFVHSFSYLLCIFNSQL